MRNGQVTKLHIPCDWHNYNTVHSLLYSLYQFFYFYIFIFCRCRCRRRLICYFFEWFDVRFATFLCFRSQLMVFVVRLLLMFCYSNTLTVGQCLATGRILIQYISNNFPTDISYIYIFFPGTAHLLLCITHMSCVFVCVCVRAFMSSHVLKCQYLINKMFLLLLFPRIRDIQHVIICSFRTNRELKRCAFVY